MITPLAKPTNPPANRSNPDNWVADMINPLAILPMREIIIAVII